MNSFRENNEEENEKEFVEKRYGKEDFINEFPNFLIKIYKFLAIIIGGIFTLAIYLSFGQEEKNITFLIFSVLVLASSIYIYYLAVYIERSKKKIGKE